MISEDEVNVAIVAFSDTVQTIVPFGDPNSFNFEKLTDDTDGIIHNINISPFASQGTYIDKALEHVDDEFRKVIERPVTSGLTSGSELNFDILGATKFKESSCLTHRWLQPSISQNREFQRQC